jgi:MYXO-CTERM domain-containing protein
MIAAALAALLTTTPTTVSKLGPHVFNPIDTDAQAFLANCPRAAVFVAQPATGSAIVALRNRCPQTEIVVRAEIVVTYATQTTTASAAADDFWGRLQATLLDIQPQNVDWLEGPHEVEQLPDWTASAANAQWVADFWSRLADLMHAVPYKPLVGSIPSGLASGSIGYFKTISDAMKQKSYTWGWSYHAYSPTLAQSTSAEASTSLLFRTIRTQCALAGFPLILTEVAQGPVGWKARGTNGLDYLNWFEWFDGQLQLDADVRGAALFQFGASPRFASFDLAGLGSQLGQWLETASFPDAGVGDGGTTGGRDAASGTGSTGQVGPGEGFVAPTYGCSCTAAEAWSLPLWALLAVGIRRRRR